MTRTLATARFAQPSIGVFSLVLLHLRHAIRVKQDAQRLDEMPRDRLRDMGIAPRTEANTRTSGEAGLIHPMPFW